MKKLVLAAVCAEVLMGVFASSAAATGWSANPGQADRNQDAVVCSSEKPESTRLWAVFPACPKSLLGPRFSTHKPHGSLGATRANVRSGGTMA